jgi:integrase
MGKFYVEVYNVEEKERFLEYIDTSHYPDRWWERLFEKSRLLETKYDKDLYGFTTAQIQELYKLLNLSLESLIVLNNNLVKYGNWALTNHLLIDGQNHYCEFDNQLLNDCVSKALMKQSVVTLKEFNNLLNGLENYQDRFIYFCMFEGIKGKRFCDVINLKMGDIDKDNQMVYTYSGKHIKVSQAFIEVCEKADRQLDYRATNRYMKLLPAATIYKSKENATKELKDRSIQRTFSRLTESRRINANAIFQSGLIYYLNERAKKLGVHVKDMIYDLDKCGDILDKYNFNKDTRGRFILKYEDFLV